MQQAHFVIVWSFVTFLCYLAVFVVFKLIWFGIKDYDEQSGIGCKYHFIAFLVASVAGIIIIRSFDFSETDPLKMLGAAVLVGGFFKIVGKLF